MPGAPSDSYTPEVMAVGCSKCGAVPLQRCRGPLGSGATNMVIAHAPRLALVGLRWDRATGGLVKLT